MPQGLGILCKVFFFFNICNGDMYFDALITGLFQICLVMDQRGVCWCVEGEVGIQFGLGASEQPGEEFCLVGLGVGGCVQFLVKVVIFMGIGEAKRQKGRFEVIQKEQATKRGGISYGVGFIVPQRISHTVVFQVQRFMQRALICENICIFALFIRNFGINA